MVARQIEHFILLEIFELGALIMQKLYGRAI